MATKLEDIRLSNWQLSAQTIGLVVEGIEDIKQCVSVILTTTKGSDPLRPLFGSDIWRFMDSPMNTAIPNISAEILDALGKWEPRINIKQLIHNTSGSRVDFDLKLELIESGEITEILFFIDRQTQITPSLIGRAFSNGFDFGFN